VTGYRFVLYVAGRTSRSERAEESLRRLCDERLGPGGYDLRVVDVLEQAEDAEAARIIVAPTVVRTHPGQVLRVIGDLTAVAKVADALGLPADRSAYGNKE
jgi:hypothetical protein